VIVLAIRSRTPAMAKPIPASSPLELTCADQTIALEMTRWLFASAPRAQAVAEDVRGLRPRPPSIPGLPLRTLGQARELAGFCGA